MADQPTSLLSEDFEDAQDVTPPEGWTQVALEGDVGVARWEFDSVGEPFDGNAAIFFHLAPAEGGEDDGLNNAALVSPVFDASEADVVFLRFQQEFQALTDGSETGTIRIEGTADGEDWTTLFSDDRTGFYDPETEVLDASGVLAGAEEAQLRLSYEGDGSVFWAVDDLDVLDGLTPGIVTPEEGVRLSEDNVPDMQRLTYAIESRPNSEVTVRFLVDGEQVQDIEPLVFTAENWTEAQTATVRAVADEVDEGPNQQSEITVEVVSNDPDYDGLAVAPVPVLITDRTIPEFETYRTVEATFEDMAQIAIDNPGLASWTDIGDSYDKVTPGGPEGYDIYALRLTNEETDAEDAEKPVLYMQGAIHAREYATTELVARFAEELVEGYGTRADTTWLLDNHEIHIVPVLNPDGRKLAEQGYLWRKNTNPNPPPGEEPAEFPNYGVDLNRNYDAQWGQVEGGSSGDPSSAVYRGEAAFSEPESQAARDYLLEIFPDQRDGNAPAPEDTTGVYLDVHSFGSLFLYPGSIVEGEESANQEELRQLGLKFGHFTGIDGEAYNVQPSDGLYATDGTTDSWVYQTFGVAAYTPELGTEFFEEPDYFEDVILPELTPALFYAAKAARLPYQLPFGPDSVGISVDKPTAFEGQTLVVAATADGTRFDDGLGEFPEPGEEPSPLPDPVPVGGARYAIDALPWAEGAETFEMEAADGAFDEAVEEVTATLDTTGLEAGQHSVYVQSRAEDGTYGATSAVFFDVLDAGDGVTEVVVGGDGAAGRTGGAGSDIVLGDQSGAPVAGGLGDDVVQGTEADDVLRGDLDSVSKQGGDDGGDDVIYGLGGDDRIGGKSGDDTLYGGAGNDALYGDAGDDVLVGGAGDDYLSGDGPDAGGAGVDTFVLAMGQGTDTVADFTAGTDLLGLAGELVFDRLDFSQSGRLTVISAGTEVLARLDGVSSDDVSEDWFVLV